MATWLKHIKLQFGGTLGNPAVEEWSNTVRFSMGPDPFSNTVEQGSLVLTSGELEDAMGDLVAPLQKWFTAGPSRINQVAKMTYIKLNMINEQGHQYDQNTHRRDVGPIPGGSTFVAVPWFQTYALTMRTDKQRGRAHSGRIFPPVVDLNPQGQTPYVDATAANGMAASWATCLTEMADALNSQSVTPTETLPVIASPATAVGPNPGPALLVPVRGVVCDLIADVQHRRTNRIPRVESARAAVLGN